MIAPWKKNYNNPRQHIKKQRLHFANKSPYSQSYGFSISHVWMWELDHKGGWVLKNWCFQIVVLSKILDSPLDCKEIKPVNPKENQYIGRADAEAEAPILWPPDAKSLLTGKDCDAGKDWRQEEKGDNRGWTSWVASLTQWTWSEVTQLCPTLCDPMNRSTPSLPVHHQLPEPTQIHVHWVGDAIQPPHPLSSDRKSVV